jgi:hypothetical protein
VSDSLRTSPKTVKRRDVLASLAAGVAGAVAAPRLAAREVDAAPGAVPEQASTGAGGPAQGVPRLLDDHRREMLAGLADQVLPGARAAGVAELLDRVLASEAGAAQRRFLDGLGAFDREARDRHSRGWTELTDAQQIEILHAASTLASARPATPPWTRGQPIDRPAGPPAPPANLRDHFDHLKDWIQRAYFTTPAGLQELGFTGRMSFPSFPGCTHPGHDHT